MKKKYLPKLTIGIPAYNEEKNILRLLSSVTSQKEEGFKIEEIIVISDGSNDNTVREANKIKDKRVKIISESQRLGKAERLNQLFSTAKGDIIVLFDSDIKILSSYTVKNLVFSFEQNSKIGLVGGNPYPKKARTFIEEAVNSTYFAYHPLRKNIRNGTNPHGCDGKILALTKKFAKTVKIPSGMIGIDSFMYLTCIKNKFKFVHNSLARVEYRSPSTIKDQINQNTRFMSAQVHHKKIFGNLFEKEYFVPKRTILSLMAKQFFKKPLHASTIFVVNLYCKKMAKLKYKTITSKWQMISSTKGYFA